jgi:hypothetical protein
LSKCDIDGEQQFAFSAVDPSHQVEQLAAHLAPSKGLLYTKTKPNADKPTDYKNCKCGWECDPSKALCDAYGGIQFFLNVGLALCGFILLIVGYRFKSQVLFLIGFVLGAMVVFPFAFMLLYQQAPTASWPLIVALVISCCLGIMFGLISKIRCIGNTTIGVLTGCLVGYVLYIIFLQLPLNASNDVKNALFGLLIFVFAIVFAILSWWTESDGHERAHRHFMCFCASYLGAFLILKGAGFLIVKAANDYNFPDSFGAYCSCLTSKDDCNAYKYACTWKVADAKAASPTCETTGATTLDDLDLAGGLYIIVMIVLTAIFWPFQDKVTSDWCGANDEEFDGREEELQREEEELHALAAKIKKMPKGPEKDAEIVEYKKRKAQYEEDRAITIELEKSRGDTSHHHAEISHGPKVNKEEESAVVGKTESV